jgi:hypothetical protein
MSPAAIPQTTSSKSEISPWLRLGRVSNLPTVWSNVLAALALAGALPGTVTWLALCVALSTFYVAGMFLNDAFDRQIDALERPKRPIPSGAVSARSVFIAGFSGLALGTIALASVASAVGSSPRLATLAGFMLALAIVVYDRYHKGNPLSPALMGACRVLVYASTACAVVAEVPPAVSAGALSLFCYLIGLTYAAKQEAFNRLTRLWPLAFLVVPAISGVRLALDDAMVWPFLLLFAGWVVYALSFLRAGPKRFVPGAVVRLIAGISLLDALLVATTGDFTWALVAVGCALLTRVLQRYVPGT